MKKLFATFLCVLLLLSVVLAVSACDDKGVTTDELVVYNSADYIYDTELTDFKEYYRAVTGKNIKITYVTYDTNETMLTKIEKGDSVVDVVCPSEYAIQKLLEGGHLVKLNYFDEDLYTDGFNFAGYEHFSGQIDTNIIDMVEAAFGNLQIKDEQGNLTEDKITDYFVPYMYGTLGILYNKQEFKRLGIYDKDVINKANWGILFNDDGSGNILSEGLTGNILMKDSIRDSYAITLFYLKESGKLDGLTSPDGKTYTDMPVSELINVADSQVLDICREVLTEQKKQLFGYEVDFGKDDLLMGNAIVDLAWSGDAMYAVDESWDDYLCPKCVSQTGEKQGTDIICSECGAVCGDYELSYYVPHSAGNIWFDGWVIPDTYDPSHLTAIKLFINFLNNPEVAIQNILEIGYSAAVSPEAIRQVIEDDDELKGELSEAYLVNSDYWEKVDEDGKQIEKFKFNSWQEFEEFFFDYRNEMDNSNWRYPFLIDVNGNGVYDRALNTLGVMRDFGENNKAVVTMWNKARSTGVNALPLLGYTVLAVAVVVGIIVLCEYLKYLKKTVVKIPKSETDGSASPKD